MAMKLFCEHPRASTQRSSVHIEHGPWPSILHALNKDILASSSVSAWLQRGLYHNLFDRIMSVDGKTQLKMLSPVYCVVSCWRARQLPAPFAHGHCLSLLACASDALQQLKGCTLLIASQGLSARQSHNTAGWPGIFMRSIKVQRRVPSLDWK